ncbi:TPA: hypothetical protein HLU32_21635 [Escherichia coli]|nr:hypothetical protein [Escherichia coli]HAJ4256995.1 hypothetical protein [Escherichia coli]HAJ4383640.1 hypothetical protein [Escherichia coli]
MDESRNNMREEFESWLAPSWSRDTYLEDEGEVEYVDDWVQGAWVGWRASRAAIEIELPPTVDGSNVPFAGNAWNAYRVEAVEAIRAAGIKVKE